MSEVLTQTPAETKPATTEVLTPPAASVTPANPTAAGATPADGATSPNPPIHAPSADTQPGGTAGSTVENLNSSEDLDAFIGMIQDGSVKLGEDLSETPPVPTTVPAVPSPQPSPTGEGAKPATPETAPATPAAALDPDDGLPAPGELPRNIKLQTKGDKLRFETLKIVKDHDTAGRTISFSAAETLAKQVLGFTEPTAPGTTEAAPPSPTGEAAATPSSDLPATIAATNDRIKALNKEKAAKAAAFDFEGAADIENQITDLTEHREGLRHTEQQSQAAERTYAATWNDAANAAANQFKDHGAGDPDSALSIIAANVQSTWINANDPRLNDPATAPGLIYAEALQKLGRPTAPAAAAAPAPVVVQPVSPVQPASRSLTPAQALLSSSPAAGLPQQRSGPSLDRFTNAHDFDAALANGEFGALQ